MLHKFSWHKFSGYTKKKKKKKKTFLFGSFSWQSFTGLFFLLCKILILLLTLLYLVWFWFFYRYFNKPPWQNRSIYPKCDLASCTQSRNDKTLIILNWPSCIKHFEGKKHITFHNVTVRLLQYVNNEKIHSLYLTRYTQVEQDVDNLILDRKHRAEHTINTKHNEGKTRHTWNQINW